MHERLKASAASYIDSIAQDLLRVSHDLHAHPELAFEEFHACELLTTTLEAYDLSPRGKVYTLETAFECEVARDGNGPVVALLAEYDALPGIGHACGHNLIATASLGAALALAHVRDALPGTVRLLGTPAEEKGGGKEIMARAGAFEGVDASMMIHPFGRNMTSFPFIAYAQADVTYRGKAAHAAAAPHRGVNALDGLLLAYQGISNLRQHIRSTERIHGIVTDGGLAANIVPETAKGEFYVRAKDMDDLTALKRRVSGCFEAGAAASGAAVEVVWGEVDYLDLRTNWPLAERFQANAEALGRTFFPLNELSGNATGSTDMGNISHRVPSIHPLLAAAPHDVAIHTPEFADYAGGELGDKAALDGAKALAMTTIDFLCSEELQKDVRRALEVSKGLA